MQYLLPLITLIVFFLSACAPVMTPLPSPLPPDTGVNSDDNPPPTEPIYAPQPGDEKLMRAAAFVEQSDILTLESYPLQFTLTLKGSLPTPCHQLRIVVNPPGAEKKINLNVYSVADPAAVCVQMIQPFEINVALGSFPAGHYTIWINGEQIGEIDA
jgi:inhibitor of cysteine peptidase